MSTSSNHIRSANTNKKQTPQFSLPSLRQKSGSHNKSPYDYTRDAIMVAEMMSIATLLWPP